MPPSYSLTWGKDISQLCSGCSESLAKMLTKVMKPFITFTKKKKKKKKKKY
jgi:hypothetical protein